LIRYIDNYPFDDFSRDVAIIALGFYTKGGISNGHLKNTDNAERWNTVYGEKYYKTTKKLKGSRAKIPNTFESSENWLTFVKTFAYDIIENKRNVYESGNMSKDDPFMPNNSVIMRMSKLGVSGCGGSFVNPMKKSTNSDMSREERRLIEMFEKMIEAYGISPFNKENRNEEVMGIMRSNMM
jgi:hypothetical protein